MLELLAFAVLGLGVGAAYSLAAQGIVAIYRGSGIVNFAQGAVGMVGVFLAWELIKEGVPYFVACAIALLTCAALGAMIHLLIMRPLRTAATITRLVATLGVLVTIQGAALIRYGSVRADSAEPLPSFPLPDFLLRAGTDKPRNLVLFTSGADEVSISADRLWTVVLAVLVTVGLWALYKYTRFGLNTTAAAENERVAGSLGLSSDRLAVINWALGSSLAAVAAILVAPFFGGLTVSALTSLVLAALAAALVGSFRSFPATFGAAMFMGIAYAVIPSWSGMEWLTSWVGSPTALANAFPLFVIVAVMVFRGRNLPMRGHILEKMPAVGTGRIRWPFLVGAVVIAALAIFLLPGTWTGPLIVSFATAIILLSLVVLIGYAGQVSLAQFALAGIGAYIAVRLVYDLNFPFVLALVVAVVGAAAVGFVFGLPAVRTRGINLAIITLGLGVAAEALVFNNQKLANPQSGEAGLRQGFPILNSGGELNLFGLDVNAVDHAERYAVICLVLLVVLVLAVSNLRRGRVGRRLIAVRANERAASAMGISVIGVKLYAFVMSSAIAAVGGVLLAFRGASAVFDAGDFTFMQSINAVAFGVIGGIGYLVGPVFGSQFFQGGVGNQLITSIFDADDIYAYLPLIGGISLLFMLLTGQDGVAPQVANRHFNKKRVATLAEVAELVGSTDRKRNLEALAAADRPAPTGPPLLTVDGAFVRYGGVVAVDSLSLEVRAGEIVGLIGSNGAGKTSAIDVITGFTKSSGGSIELDGTQVENWSAAKRSRAGLVRSFQSLELFEDLTVADNLRTASDRRDFAAYLTDIVMPGTSPLPPGAQAAVQEFGLDDVLEERVSELSYGRRRLLAIARALASEPKVLLLDEPAAGLDDQETAELAQLLHAVASRGLAVILVEHDLNLVMEVCDQLVVLEFGKTIASGPTRDVRVDPKVIASYLGESSTGANHSTAKHEPTADESAAVGTDSAIEAKAGSV
ncbi:branched-chain amino acid ABC transporter permease/ATP-binding protein [Rhodococcoides fascians]|uniref:branched-chain amino acid ABC transporter permease/ATP-binding protein n=1 Tax=Rhodococcoides fascians TaxID=1828 RepID=UPI00050C79DA|nr:branched-chain amino acid ABC transporter permease/ATP-binding protein [Rhodococcus fascians]